MKKIPADIPTEKTQLRFIKENLTLLSSWDELSLYQWGTRTAKDYFCKTCGILPFRRPRDATADEISNGAVPFDDWAINVRCLKGGVYDDLQRRYIDAAALPL